MNKEETVNLEEVSFTHKTVVTVYSNGDSEMVSVKVELEPDMTGEDIEQLGYMPAAYTMLEDYLYPAIQQAKLEWEENPIRNAIPASNSIN